MSTICVNAKRIYDEYTNMNKFKAQRNMLETKLNKVFKKKPKDTGMFEQSK